MSHNLVLAFPDQSPSFAHGFACGQVWGKMMDKPTQDIVGLTMLAETRTTIEAMAMAQGWVEEIVDIGDGWIWVTLRSPAPADPSTRAGG